MRVGTFIKTPAAHVVEVLGLSGLDFAVIDAEHGPFERASCDLMMIAGRAAGLSLMIRVPDMQAATLLWALDVGAAGLVVPHVDTPGQAAELVHRARFKGGGRGFSNAGRYARFGTTTLTEAVEAGDQATLFAQIESGAAVANAAAIAATPGVAGLVVGRADLALSLGETRLDAPAVLDGTRTALSAAHDAGKEGVIVTGDASEASVFLEMGATMIIIGSDQTFMRTAASRAVSEMAAVVAAQARTTRSG